MSKSSPKPSRLILAASLLAVLLLVACSGDKAAKAAAAGPAGHAGKVRADGKSQKVNDTTEYVATLKSRDSAVVMPQVEGIITQILVHSGENVADGAAMMQIDPAKQEATVKSQEQRDDRTTGATEVGAAELRTRQRAGQRRSSQQAGIRPGPRHSRCGAGATAFAGGSGQ